MKQRTFYLNEKNLLNIHFIFLQQIFGKNKMIYLGKIITSIKEPFKLSRI